jgi:hypothetical protein
VPPAKTVDLRPAAGGEATSVPSEKITEAPPNANPVSASDAGTPPEQVAAAPAPVDLTTVTAGPALEQKAESTTESPAPADAIPPADAEMTVLASPDIADQSDATTTPEQSATAPAAEDPTTATAGPALDQKADSNTETGPAEATPSAAAETTTALASPNSAEQLVAILLVRPEINSVSDLANKVVAIDVSRSESVPSVRTAIVAAGAAQVRMSAGEALALTRVIDGEVSAAVVTLASPEEAEMWTAGVQGLKILRVPLSPPSEDARRG